MYSRVVISFLALIFLANLAYPNTPSQEESLADLVIQENIKGTSSSGSSKIKFEARKALFNRAKNTLEMQDSVRIETEEGLVLETERINWDQGSDTVFTDQPVTITKEKSMRIDGVGLNAQPGLQTARIQEDITVKIPQKDNSFIMITCQGPMEMEYDKGIAVFYNDVKVNQKDSELYSDKATMYFDTVTRTLDRVVAEGNVRIVRGKDTSYSEKATYMASTKKVILEGRPRLVIFPDEGESPF